ncbi:LytTR family DNA-binding domain-containing protein [Sporolactobacillus sp. THM19-2]|uniref:LytR/AlgR family response regulator transcription factor n=1 Tax=Sporolactobacillus sp. THM19-2 TaxID=2511171 RepID=UPI00101F58E9|nr:LytTR family DNA-binding domain-containing protein [Sporolactobacillus sp. THM19-2]RYL94631.1 response regulator transcription factor [Sporolactobacillus sp. THM19-2]
MMKIAICDDDKTQCDYLTSLVNKWASNNRIHVITENFISAGAFLFSWSKDKSYDVLLLDIQMPGLNGMELARTIRKCDESLAIIFITGYSDYMDEGYEVSALHYLMKPVKEEKLYSCLNRASKRNKTKPKVILVESGGEMQRIPQNEIVCAEAFAHTLDITTTNQHLRVNMSIENLEKMLDPGTFFRPHRSYLVGLRFIRRFGKNEMILDNGRQIPVSRRRYKAANQAFIDFFRGSGR